MPQGYKKQYGQHFLSGDRFAHKLVEPLDIQKGELVIEIGPGDGRVTNILLHKEALVVAVEVDYDLIPKLIMRFKERTNFHLIHKDILATSLEEIFTIAGVDESTPYKVTGSLPYNIYKDIIAKFLKLPHRPTKMSFIVQEEVAYNYIARPPKALYLSNWVQMYANVRKLESIPRSQFFPKPKVNGAIITLDPLKENSYEPALDKLIQQGFSFPRKTLLNNLGSVYGNDNVLSAINDIGLDTKVRPAEISFEIWQRIRNILA